MEGIFDFDQDSPHAPTSQTIETIEVSEREKSLKYDFQTARRIEIAKSVLMNQSILALKALENKEPISLTRARYLAMLNPKWNPEIEKEIFTVKSYQKTIDFSKSSVTLVTPSNNMLEILEDSRPSSYSSSFSPSSFKSSSKLRFTDQ